MAILKFKILSNDIGIFTNQDFFFGNAIFNHVGHYPTLGGAVNFAGNKLSHLGIFRSKSLLYQVPGNCQVRRKYYLMARWRITANVFSAKATAWSIMEGLFSDMDKKYALVTTNSRLI